MQAKSCICSNSERVVISNRNRNEYNRVCIERDYNTRRSPCTPTATRLVLAAQAVDEMASQAMPHPPLPPGWRSEWCAPVPRAPSLHAPHGAHLSSNRDSAVGRMLFIGQSAT